MWLTANVLEETLDQILFVSFNSAVNAMLSSAVTSGLSAPTQWLISICPFHCSNQMNTCEQGQGQKELLQLKPAASTAAESIRETSMTVDCHNHTGDDEPAVP